MANSFIFLILIFVFTIFANSQDYKTYTDKRDNKVYKYVDIVDQTWMAENLDVTTFRNGDKIREAKTDNDWMTTEPLWCYHNYDSNNSNYGKFYNFYAVIDPRGLAPEGWHIPSDAEWTILANNLGGEDLAGKKMKSIVDWMNSGNGDNSSGFNGLPAGYWFHGKTEQVGLTGNWWSSTMSYAAAAWYRYLSSGSDALIRYDLARTQDGMSVRCIKN